MKWKIRYSKQAMKFLSKNSRLNVDVYIIKAIKRVFFQEDTNIDVKKMKGGWKGYYRIKEGDLRIILDFKKDEAIAYVYRVGWRGNIYK
jgi:mRNA interferase RelE/StbE